MCNGRRVTGRPTEDQALASVYHDEAAAEQGGAKWNGAAQSGNVYHYPKKGKRVMSEKGQPGKRSYSYQLEQEYDEACHELELAVKHLQQMAGDFTPGANGRFNNQVETCKRLKERVCSMEVRNVAR